MAEIADIILEKLASLERRIDRLESLVLAPQQKKKDEDVHPHPFSSLHSFAVSNVDRVFFHYKSRGYTHMQQVLEQLIAAVSFNATRRKTVNVYAEFVTGRPDLAVNGSQFGKGNFNILLFIVTPGVTTIGREMYRKENYDAQSTIVLDGSFQRIDFKVSRVEVEQFQKHVNST